MLSTRNHLLQAARPRLLLAQNQSTFKASDIKITRTKRPLPKPDPSKLVFGKVFSDHMLVSRWTSAKGWEAPEIKPVTNLEIHPAAKVLHYAQEIFEGMKGYRGVDGAIRLFRPDRNALRMLKSAERSCLPTFDTDEFIKCIKRLVKEDADWVPPCDKDLTRSPSLYIRPFMIGTEPTLGVASSSEVLFSVLIGPVGPYFPSGFKPVSLLADPSLVRSWPGGTGFAKMGSNYAPTLALQKHASSQGCQQVLWLFGKEHYLTEVGTMNILIALKGKNGKKFELVTPPLQSGLILPGVTRESILDLARSWNDTHVTERDMSLDELLQLAADKQIIEVFGAGTAAIVCPVAEVVYNGKRHSVAPEEGATLLSQRAVVELTGMQFGVPEYLKKHPDWMVKV